MPEHAVISGSAGGGTYSQALLCGNFCLAFSLAGEEVNLELGRNTVSRLEEICTQSPETTPAELADILQHQLPSGISLDFVVAKTENNKLAVTAFGETSAKLVRQGKIINLLSKTKTIAGPVQEGDILVLGTQAFFQNAFSPELVAQNNLSDFRDNLSLKIESLPDNAKIAALAKKISLQQEVPAAMEPVEGITRKKLNFSTFRLPTNQLTSRLVNQSSRRTLYFAAIILLVLISLIAFQLRSRNLEQRTRTAASIEKIARDGQDSAQKLAGLNDNMARDILLQTRQDVISKANETFGDNWQNENGTETKKLKAVLANLDAQLAQVSHIFTLDKLDVFSDFDLLRANANITAASLNNNEMVVVDANNGAVYSLGTKSKTAAIVGGGEDFKKGAFVDFNGDSVYVYTPVGIYSINRATNSLKTLFKPSDKWGQIKGLRTFAGNLYLLDTGNSQIWKYQGTDLGFASPSAYLRTGSVDLSNVTSFAIEGAIFVLSSRGNIAEFASGSTLDFDITGMDKPLNNPTSIFTSDEVNNLYILDTGNNRVIILDKKGNYQAQYGLPVSSLQSPATILADESVRKVFLLSGSKVYSFDLH